MTDGDVMFEAEMGVTEVRKVWAYCNFCQWTGPDRPNYTSAANDLWFHRDTPGHDAHRLNGGR